MALEDNKEALFLAGALGVSAAMLYKGKQLREVGELSKVTVISTPGKLIPAKPVKISLPEEALKKASDAQKLALGEKSKAKNNLGKLVRPSIPVRLSDKIALSDMRKDGFLGRLVAQYYAFERARIFYMSRCGAYHFSDDTPTWLQREKQLVSKTEIDKKLKDPKWFGVALENAAYLDRWDGGNSKSELYRRRYSLEATFCNWCGPPFTGSNQYKRPIGIHSIGSSFCKIPTHKKITSPYLPTPEKVYENWSYRNGAPYWRDCSANIKATESCKNGKLYERLRGEENLFYRGGFPFGMLMLHKAQQVIAHGYQYPNGVATGHYEEVCYKDYYAYDNIPWRNFKGVSWDDRVKATYTLPIENDFKLAAERQHRIGRYYEFGYQLVRTMLDILCAYGAAAENYPEFAEHCTWWCIPQPTAKFIGRYPDLTVIGSGVQGFQKEQIPEMLEYVMAITPKPGTIAPWEDKGPLWTWPESTGHLQPLPIGLAYRERKSDYIMGTIVQYILSFETSICSNVASGVANTVINEAIKWAESICSEWITEGLDLIMEQLNTTFGQTAIGEVKEVLKDVSGFAANMSRFVDAEQLIGDLSQGTNLAGILTDYLDAASLSQYSDYVSGAKQNVLSAVDGLRKQWDWADELLGSAASLGKKVNNTLNNLPVRY